MVFHNESIEALQSSRQVCYRVHDLFPIPDCMWMVEGADVTSKAIGYTATEAIYGISRDRFGAGVVYRCDCGCDEEIQSWTTKKRTYNLPLFFVTISLTIFKCMSCSTWFFVGPTLLWSFRLFGRKPMPDEKTPRFYERFFKKTPSAPDPAEEEKPEKIKYEDLPCFRCGTHIDVETKTLEFYCEPDETSKPAFNVFSRGPFVVVERYRPPVFPSGTRICKNCMDFIDHRPGAMANQVIWCGECESYSWAYPGKIADDWQKYFKKKPDLDRMKDCHVAMVDHCEGCG